MIENGELAELKIHDIKISLITDALFPKHLQRLKNKIFVFPSDLTLGTFMRDGNYSVLGEGDTHSCLNTSNYIYVNLEQQILMLSLPLSEKSTDDDDEFSLGDFDSMEVPDVEIEVQPQSMDDDCEGGACKI